MSVLLIGNGPAALAKEVGHMIDAFPGKVARFNNYKTEGFGKFVGTRTDIWFTCERNVVQMEKEHKARYFISWREDEPTAKTVEATKAVRVPRDIMMQTIKTMGYHCPSSGAIACEFLLSRGEDVYLWGFDFLCQRRDHHYNKDGQERGQGHDEWAEWNYFNKLVQQGRVFWFGLGKYESVPIFRQPVPCGKDDNLSWYREAAHNAWYDWFGTLMMRGIPKTITTPAAPSVLDVGAGMGEGMKVLASHGCRVTGHEIDPRLQAVVPELIIGDLNQFDDKSFDYVTCVDVIEHCVEDLKLMAHMKRIARQGIFVTTPCYTRSRCGNIAHCREYSIAQFANIFEPTEVWSASPDGTIHKTMILEQARYEWRDLSPQGPDNTTKADPEIIKKPIPVTRRFNKTVDGEEWAHICGIWRL